MEQCRDYTLPLETDWTVDDLAILPRGCRYELIDGRLDLWDRDSLAELAGLALMAELKAACPSGFRATTYSRLGIPACWIFEATDGVGGALTALRLAENGGFDAEPSTGEVFVTDWPFPVSIDLPLVSQHWPQAFE